MIHFTKMGQGPDLVVLHGWSHDGRHMQPLVDLLKNRFTITLIDLPGCGKSDWDNQIKTIHDVADRLLPYLPKRAIYLAWSFGGLVTLSLAARHPERVARFIGIATAPRFVEDSDWTGVPKPGFMPFFTKIEMIGTKDFLKGFYDTEFGDQNPKPEGYHRLVKLAEERAMDPKILLKGIEIVDATDLRREFQSVSCPIDLIITEKDGSIPLGMLADMQKLNPNAHIHLLKQGYHMPFWTHPKEFNALLEEILTNKYA